MKNTTFLKRSAALFMAVLFILSSAVTASAASDFKSSKAAEGIIETLGNTLSALLPRGEDFTPVCKYKSENFYEGTGFEKQSATGKWSLGSAEGILTPDDLFEKTYYTGGGYDAALFDIFNYIGKTFISFFQGDFTASKQSLQLVKNCAESMIRMFSNKFCCVIKQKFTDMCVRAVSVDDGTGRGATAIAVVDCIGIANSDVREIRSRIADKITDKDAFSSITVAATHCHSCIDTQGIWTNAFEKVICNFMKRLLRIGTPEKGYDTEYMEFLYDKVADTVINAYNNMEQGSMTYASKKNLNEYNNYFLVKKRIATTKQIIDDMNRFVFTPDNKNSKPTMIVNMAAHPYYTSIATSKYPQSRGDGLSGDFIYYMGQTICKAGYNFMFFNGSVAHVYTDDPINRNGLNSECRDELMQLYGIEMGKMALSLTKTIEEIKADSYLYDAEIDAQEAESSQKFIEDVFAYAPENYFEEYPDEAERIIRLYSHYSWYIDWTPAEEITLEPVFNTVFKEIHIKVTNPVIKLAGKLNLASNEVLYDLDSYYIVSEIGYMELGNKVKLVLMPGEVFPDMQRGGGMLTAEKSYSGEDFAYPCIEELFGENTIVFGLANDAIGYIVPDNDYILCFDFENHYHELFSAGKNTASFLMSELVKIKEEVS